MRVLSWFNWKSEGSASPVKTIVGPLDTFGRIGPFDSNFLQIYTQVFAFEPAIGTFWLRFSLFKMWPAERIWLLTSSDKSEVFTMV